MTVGSLAVAFAVIAAAVLAAIMVVLTPVAFGRFAQFLMGGS